jgi:hypothetical protein
VPALSGELASNASANASGASRYDRDSTLQTHVRNSTGVAIACIGKMGRCPG